LRIEVLDEIPEDPELRRSWNDLALKMERPEVFYTYDWAIAVQRAYRGSLATLVFLAYEGGALVGLVALASRKGACHEVAFLAGSTADYCDFLSDRERRSEFVAAVLDLLKQRNVAKIVLANLPADSCSVAAIPRCASGSRYYLHSRLGYLCARVLLPPGAERVALKRSIVAKRRLRRNMRDLEKLGRVSVPHDKSWNRIEPVLQSFARAHVARFLETGRISNLIRAERRAFLYELARELSRSGWITLSRLMVGDAASAWNYGFEFAGSWFWYQPTVNSSYEAFSPGYCLLSKIVELACDQPDTDVVDLGLGAEGYKERFATANRRTLYCELNGSLSKHLLVVMRQAAAAAAKTSPRVEGWIRAGLSRVSRLRARLREAGVWSGLVWMVRRARRSLFAFEEVHFFEWDRGDHVREGSSATLRPLDSELLGEAAIACAGDPATLEYLLRSSAMHRTGQARGFVLLTAGIPTHFCWVKDFEGFQMAELERTLHATSKDAVMIFDCYTPPSARGHGFFAEAIGALAARLHSEGKTPWVFGAATNHASLQGIKKAGFTYKYSLWRKRILFVREGKRLISFPEPENAARSVPVP
jgi:CelD/BcsL family acetyltransferase involved in cellulose biosynthesis